MKNGIELIVQERHRQIEEEGWTANHDDQQKRHELAKVAICYTEEAIAGVRWGVPDNFPREWSLNWWKPSGDPIKNLVKAGALIAAEIDRLRRNHKDKEASHDDK